MSTLSFNFDICRANHGGQEDSEAANRVTNKSVDREKIKDWLAGRKDGGTCDEAEVELKMPHQTCSARFSELKSDNEIEFLGKRKTRSGCNASVYQVKR